MQGRISRRPTPRPQPELEPELEPPPEPGHTPPAREEPLWVRVNTPRVNSLTCADCEHPMHLCTRKGWTYPSGGKRLIYRCENCGATHGADRDGTPNGKPGDLKTRVARGLAHKALDPLWQEGHVPRRWSYYAVMALMDLSKEEAHIARFTRHQCEQLVERLEAHTTEELVKLVHKTRRKVSRREFKQNAKERRRARRGK